MNHKLVMWIVFNALVALILYVDLFLLNKHSHKVSLKEAALWWSVWVSMALAFFVGIYFYLTPEKAMQFLSGYLIEQSLSVDNMFVFILIFSYFNIGAEHQPRVLKWGILGAVVLRFIMIWVGTSLVNRFHWVLYVFGVILIYSAYKMAFGGEEKFDPQGNPVFRLIKKIMPVTGFHGENFFVRLNGVNHATSLFIALAIVEFSDVVFALDSIPAVFAITTDTFIVYTSNVFAILGLRALFFMLNSLVQTFKYLKYGVAAILVFVGVKMISADFIHISTVVSLAVIVGVLMASVFISVMLRPRTK